MDSSLVFVNLISLLYFETHLQDKTVSSADAVRAIIEKMKSPEEKLTIGEVKDVNYYLKTTTLDLANYGNAEPLDKDIILQRLRVNCMGDENLYSSLETVIGGTYTQEEIKKKVLGYRLFLSSYEKETQITDLIKTAYRDLSWGRDKIKSLSDYAMGLSAKLETFKASEVYRDPAVVADLNFSDLNSLTRAMHEMVEEQSTDGMLKTGFKAINIMTQGGFRRGEFWMLPALQHSYKTGWTLTLFKQMAELNTPFMLDKSKKPLMLRISFEDTMPQNLRYLYENVHYNKHGELPDISKISYEKMANEVISTITKKGYFVIMRRVDATRWTYKDLFNYILELESQGYEIHLCMLDYLSLLPKTGCEEGPMGHSLRDLYRRVRAFFSARKITCLTPHQLSTEAKQLIRGGHSDFLSEIVGRGYFADCKQLDQEVDGEMYLHIVKFNKRAYLTIMRGKHRGVPIIRQEEMSAVYLFPTRGPIPDDIDKPRSDLSRVGGPPLGENGHVDEEDNLEEMAF